MATSIPLHPTSQTVNQLLVKLNHHDPDFRFMSLNDLITVLENSKPDLLHHDYNTAARTVDCVVKALDDQNGEVQNQAIKCLGPLVTKLHMNLISPLMEKLSTLKLENSVDNSIPALALRNVIEALPRPVPGASPSKDVLESYTSISRVLIPRLLGRNVATQKINSMVPLPDPGQGLVDNIEALNSDTVDVLIELIKCFGLMLRPLEIEALQTSIEAVLDNSKATSAVRKRAVVALSILAVYLENDQLDAFISRAVKVLKSSKTDSATRRLYLTILGSMARSISSRFGQHIGTVVQLTLESLSDDKLQKHLEEISDGDDSSVDFAEVREAALVSLEAFLASCPSDMRKYTAETIGACLRYLKYDPNYAVDDDDEMDIEEDEDDEDGFEEDDEFEAANGFEDDDDASWKVRRCAAKALYTLVSTRSSGDLLEEGTLYGQVAPPMIKRFDEREENVRLEVIATVSLLVRKTGEGVIPEFLLDNSQGEYTATQQPMSRKRRRQSSTGVSAAMHVDGNGLTSPTMDRIPSTGPRADLAKLTPHIVKASTKLLKGKSVPSKQAAMNLLDDMILVQQGGLSEQLDQLFDLIIDAIKQPTSSSTSTSLSTSGGAASATPATLRVAALRLMSDIAKTHSSNLLQPFLSKMVTAVVAIVHDRFYKISSQAIQTTEEIIKAITPPRSRKTAQKYKGDLSKLYDVILDRTTANDADAEVRHKAIHALGTLLSRTGSADGAGLLAADKRKEALDALLDRLKNETSRLAAVKAIDEVAALSSTSLEAAWVRSVALELAAQLRKANRALRGSSVHALRHLIVSPVGQASLDQPTIKGLLENLLQVIGNNDAHLLGPTLLILSRMVQVNAKLVVSAQLRTSICQLLQLNVVAAVLNPLLELVTEIGRAGVGATLMAALLKDVGISGDPATVGKVIGTLLVASGGTAGVDLDSFAAEAETHAGDSPRASLALSVLGEAGLRLGTKSPLQPQIFLKHLGDDYDKFSLTAAMALGRAGAGNVPMYLPVILEALKPEGAKQYLLLQSIKEILQQDVDISQYSATIWAQLLTASQVEDNKAVCAECVGRLAIIDPETYIPKLDNLLKDDSTVIRAIAVQALRYTTTDSGDTFDAMLQNYLVGMLTTMLQDPDMETRRLGMTTFTSAANNKPDLVLTHLPQLMPYVMHESVIKPELIREVQMGPFKHLVDDGLEVRKGAYETLYALMETAFSRISIIELYNRIIDGLRDDHDIRALSNLMLSKLVIMDPEETTRRLDAIADAFRTTLSNKLKENAVKQEHEKQDEANRSVLRTTLLLGEKLKNLSVTSTGSNQGWANYWDWVNKDFDKQLKSLREENEKIGHTYA